MNQDISQIIEEELVISKATSHPEDTVFSYEPGGKLKLKDGSIVANTMTTDFLGFGSENRILGNYYCGQSQSLCQLQDSLSDFLQTEDTLILGSYEALCADIMESLLNTEDVIIYDSAISLPMRRGIKSCQADKMRFPHSDIDKLEQQLKLSVMKRIKVILTDGIFFDSGDCALLKEIHQLASQYNALVIMDDSNGFLTCGKNGRGADEHCGVRGFQDLKIVNMQNSLCCSSGVFVSGNHNLLQLLKLRSRCYRHSISVSESDITRAREILKAVSENTERIELMHAKANALCDKLRKLGYQSQKPVAGIVSFVTESSAEKIKGELRKNGLVAQYSKVGRNTLVSLKVSANYDY
ncbi:MAG: aminotransferase class I/II-fold pyridoxal phosphate-dependent enzyme [Bacteroidales bacterium]|nr:aminotransferase class I/II-fold pyridoxal phosphate-dependent enzyme [Bacteroidales bacterium]